MVSQGVTDVRRYRFWLVSMSLVMVMVIGGFQCCYGLLPMTKCLLIFHVSWYFCRHPNHKEECEWHTLSSSTYSQGPVHPPSQLPITPLPPPSTYPKPESRLPDHTTVWHRSGYTSGIYPSYSGQVLVWTTATYKTESTGLRTPSSSCQQAMNFAGYVRFSPARPRNPHWSWTVCAVLQRPAAFLGPV